MAVVVVHVAAWVLVEVVEAEALEAEAAERGNGAKLSPAWNSATSRYDIPGLFILVDANSVLALWLSQEFGEAHPIGDVVDEPVREHLAPKRRREDKKHAKEVRRDAQRHWIPTCTSMYCLVFLPQTLLGVNADPIVCVGRGCCCFPGEI